MSFSTTKDRAFGVYETMSSWLARRSAPVRRVIYGVLGGIFWLAYLFPGNSLRPTMAGLARHVGVGSKTGLFRQYVQRFLTGTDKVERVRHGFGADLDGKLEIPDRARLDGMLERGGVFLALPHVHSSIAMCRCLAQSYPMLAVVSLTRNKSRADAQRALYAQLGCDILDVRSEEPGTVARQILKALKSGKIVVGTVDRIQRVPEVDFDKAKDIVRATAFGEPVGVGAWPTRFATKAKAPIVPAVVEQTPGGMRLVLGRAVEPMADVVETTQAWVTELESLIRAYPEEWTFSLDKHWSRVLRQSP